MIDLRHGDCREVMASLPENSVDAIVADPPYGLEFMGKEWDKLTPAQGKAEYKDRQNFTPRKSDFKQGVGTNAGMPKKNARCRKCGKLQFDHGKSKCRCAAPGFNTRQSEYAFLMQSWHESWAREAYRVLKPGGHLLAFGGSRTYHRLACAIEDAGFEIRDQLQWIYGSGFPKSLNVGKAMDKARDDSGDIVRVAFWLRPHVERFGFAKMAAHFGVSEPMVRQHWCSQSQTATPTWDQWLSLKDLLGFGDEMDAEVWRLNGRKGQPGEAWYEREVVGTSAHKSGIGNDTAGHYTVGGTRAEHYDITAPATDLAHRWQGFGTALKPAHEPIVLARKPLGTFAVNVLEMVESSLRERGVGEIQWTKQPADPAEKPSQEPTLFQSNDIQTDSVSVDRASERATPLIASAIASDCELSTTNANTSTQVPRAIIGFADQLSSATQLLTPTVASAPAAESKSECSSPWTTSTGAELSTGNPSITRSTTTSSERGSRPAIESFAGIATGLTGSLAHVRIERSSDGSFLWPENLPRFIAASSTVAANVAAHGTGALNIDGCRIATTDTLARPFNDANNDVYGTYQRFGNPVEPLGRWPANVILDEESSALLDAQSGERKSGANPTRRGSAKFGTLYGDFEGQRECIPARGAESGGASRFYFCAKASRAERNAGLDGLPERRSGVMQDDGYTWTHDGKGNAINLDTKSRNHHPTVKPLSLMKWLLTLVVPPGGTVLDPFLGSGSTACAAALLGISCIGIEAEEEYLEIARRRVAHWEAVARHQTESSRPERKPSPPACDTTGKETADSLVDLPLFAPAIA